MSTDDLSPFYPALPKRPSPKSPCMTPSKGDSLKVSEDPEIPNQKSAKRYSKKRCSHCNKKLPLCGRFECRCGKTFCSAHRYAEEHHCTYEYKTDYVKPEELRATKMERL